VNLVLLCGATRNARSSELAVPHPTPLTRSHVPDEEYGEKLKAFAAENGLNSGGVKDAFRDHYRTFEETTSDGTPPEVLRRLAFHKLRWDPPAEVRETDSGK
jgi:hypothetical protein